MIGRRSWMTMWALAASAEDNERAKAVAVLAEMAAALSNGLPAAFLRHVAPNATRYADLASGITRLANAWEIASSVELREFTPRADGALARVDWYLGLKSRTDARATEQRRQLLDIAFDKPRPARKRWLVTDIEPAGFFR
jgi:hypothetical protein